MDNPSFPQKLKQAISSFEELQSVSQSPEFLSCYVSFLISTKSGCEDVNLVSFNMRIQEKILVNRTL